MIIAESSKIDEHNFPPWNKAIHEEQKNYQAKNFFEDGTFSYDLEKIRNLYDPQASIGRIKNCENARLWGEDFRKDLSIFQGKSLTCSLISALLTILNYENIKKVKLIENIIHPQNVSINNIHNNNE